MTTATRPLAVVTGASNGIGYKTAKQFAQNSTDLLVTSTGSFPKWGVNALCDRTLDGRAVDETVINAGDKGGGSDGIESDTAGRIYITSYKHNAILRRHPNRALETIAHDPHLL
jgi:NAD(P)-dependent dehydrogenase (short-subunit alcohol dehydrogenase family)